MIRTSRVAAACLLAAAVVTLGPPVTAQVPTTRTFKIAFYNIQSGKGESGLPGIATPFADTANCTDPSLPMNAWGQGIVQRELAASVGSDPSVVALGLAEAWACANPAKVKSALGWAAMSSERNGVGMIARYGFAGPEQWLQLDTTRNLNPADTMWVLRVPVCLDSRCSQSIVTFTAHWFGTAPTAPEELSIFERQSQQTIDFMNALPAGQPHVFVGDLNVFEGTQIPCGGSYAKKRPVQMLREAGYLDAWTSVQGSAEGNTGMWNRVGCGTPEGYLYKRIDYVWSKWLGPLSISRFGMVTPGQPAPSDHAGLIAEYATPEAKAVSSPPTANIRTPLDSTTLAGTVTVAVDAQDDQGIVRVELLMDGAPFAVSTTAPFTFGWKTALTPNGVHRLQAAATDAASNRTLSAVVTVTLANPLAVGDEAVLYASDATVAGAWQRVSDGTAAEGVRLQSPDAGVPQLGWVPTRPTSYLDFSFDAVAGKPYRVWIRGKAQADSPLNDAVYVQFDRSLNAAGAPAYRMGTVTGLNINLEECDGCGLSGWGWQDPGWPIDVLGPVVYFETSGRQQMRIQAREDGIGIDQVVVSSVQFLNQPPGPPKNDGTIVARPVSGLPLPNIPPAVTLTAPAAGATFTAPASVTISANALDADGTITLVEFFAGGSLIGTRTAGPYSIVWNNVPAGTYAITGRAFDSAGASTTTTVLTVQVAPSAPSGTDEVVLYASRAPVIAGNWIMTADASAAGGSRLQNPDAGAAKVTQALAAPANYFDLTFTADAGKPYRLWVRAIAQNNDYNNDSLYVQFDGSIDEVGNPVNRIGTTSATAIVLEDCGGCGEAGWGWQDNGYGAGVLGPVVYFATSGTQRARIQVREDGLGIDQVVLSSRRYLTQSPGALKNDATVLPLVSAPNAPPTVALTGPAAGSTFTAPASIALSATAADVDGGITRVEFYAGATLLGSRTATPYSLAWTSVPAGTYSLTARAFDTAGASTTSAAVTVQVSTVSVPTGTDEVVLYAKGAPVIAGNWLVTPDATAAGGARLQNPDAGAPKLTTALAAPSSYFELTFTADARKPYRLWVRAIAQNNDYSNDSLYVQFDGSVDQSGTPVNQIGTSSAAAIVLEDCGGCGEEGWGWQDNGYGTGVLGPLVYFANSGPQRLRVQVREDGLGIDQVVLSAVKYATQAPGALKNDKTVLTPVSVR
jgi:Big-like domain-containing protein